MHALCYFNVTQKYGGIYHYENVMTTEGFITWRFRTGLIRYPWWYHGTIKLRSMQNIFWMKSFVLNFNTVTLGCFFSN